MALKISTQYANATAASASYPNGSFKNETAPGALDGTPLEKAWPDDLQGLLQSILVAAGITASGSADTVLAPQYLAGIFNLRYYSRVDYKVGTTVTGSNGIKYVCQVANGPASVIVDPITESPRTYWFTEQATRFDVDNPIGTIRMTTYSPHAFPAGSWLQTMVGRFPVGVNAADPDWDAAGETGGAKTHSHAPGTLSASSHTHSSGGITAAGHALTVAEMPAHSHTVSFETVENDGGTAGSNLDNSQVPAEFTANTSSVGSGDEHTHTISGSTGSTGASVTGSTATASNVPPYQAAYYWVRTA